MRLSRTRVAVALGSILVFAGCGSTVTPEPTAAPTATSTPTEAPVADLRPAIPLDGDCERLLTTPEVQTAIGLPVEPAASDQLVFPTQVAVLNGLQCEWVLDRSRLVALTVFPSSVLDGSEPRSEDCWGDAQTVGMVCFFDRIIGEYWFAGFVETTPQAPVAPQAAIDTLTDLVHSRLDDPVPPSWQPDGAWRSDIACEEFAGLDLRSLGVERFTPYIGETGGNAGPGPWFAYDRSGYTACDFETDDLRYAASIRVQPGGGWALDDMPPGPSVEVRGAQEARITEPWEGNRMLAVSDGVNLLMLGSHEVDVPAALAGIAEQVLALPLR